MKWGDAGGLRQLERRVNGQRYVEVRSSSGRTESTPNVDGTAIFVGLLDDPPSRLQRDGIPEGGAAAVRLMVIFAIVLPIANWRMRHIRLAGAAD